MRIELPALATKLERNILFWYAGATGRTPSPRPASRPASRADRKIRSAGKAALMIENSQRGPDLLRAAREVLRTAAAGVPGAAWGLSSPCEKWTVTQVLQHAAGDQMAYASVLTGGPARLRIRSSRPERLTATRSLTLTVRLNLPPPPGSQWPATRTPFPLRFLRATCRCRSPPAPAHSTRRYTAGTLPRLLVSHLVSAPDWPARCTRWLSDRRTAAPVWGRRARARVRGWRR